MNEKYKYQYAYAKNKLKRVPLDLRLEDYERLKEYCERNNLTINGFIKSLILDQISDKNQD